MTEHARPSPRPIAPREAAVIPSLLARAATESNAGRYLPAIDQRVVVARCDRGCDTVEFERSAGAFGHPVADGVARTPEGRSVGILLLGTASELTSLEVFQLEDDAPGRPPDPETIGPCGPWRQD
jgi:hypothetical protein